MEIINVRNLDFMELSNYSIKSNGDVLSHNYLRMGITRKIVPYKIKSGYMAVKLIDDLAVKL